MTFTEMHLAVREALRGSPFSQFMVTVQSLEQHPGRIEVEWRVFVNDAEMFFKGYDPFALLGMVRAKVLDLARAKAETEPPPPAALDAVGAPPGDGALLLSLATDEAKS